MFYLFDIIKFGDINVLNFNIGCFSWKMKRKFIKILIGYMYIIYFNGLNLNRKLLLL